MVPIQSSKEQLETAETVSLLVTLYVNKHSKTVFLRVQPDDQYVTQ